MHWRLSYEIMQAIVKSLNCIFLYVERNIHNGPKVKSVQILPVYYRVLKTTFIG